MSDNKRALKLLARQNKILCNLGIILSIALILIALFVIERMQNGVQI